MRIRPLEKYLYFPTTFHSPFECAFEPSSCFFSSASSSPRPSKVVHFLSYLLFERAFEPSTIKGSAFPILPPFERAFKPSSYLLFEHAFEPSTIKPRLISIRAHLQALVLSPFECAFEPSSCFFFSAPSSPRPSKVAHFLSYLLLSAP